MTTASDYSDYVFYWVKTWKLLFSGGELTFDEAGEIFPDGRMRMSKYSVVGGLPPPPILPNRGKENPDDRIFLLK